MEEKKIYDLSLQYEKLDTHETKKWSHPAPSIPTVLTTPTDSNILHVDIPSLRHSMDGSDSSQSIITTTADRRVYHTDAKNLLSEPLAFSPQDSPVLCWTSIADGRQAIGTSMSGQIALYDYESRDIIDTRRDHSKYVIKATTFENEEGTLVATAGWDARINLYQLSKEGARYTVFGNPIATLTLPTNPEDVILIPDPRSEKPLLLVTRRDSTSIHYFTINTDTEPILNKLGTQNLSPHSTWTTFSPSCISICPTDSTLLAVATSSLPHMRLIIVRLLIPSASPTTVEHTTQASQARAALAVQDREEKAILLHVSTLAPQSPYSTPILRWRPSGDGVWVNGDDGCVRGIDAKSGKVVAVLKDGHEAGCKVRTLWAGWVEAGSSGGVESKEEWVVSGAFDRKVIIWRPEKA